MSRKARAALVFIVSCGVLAGALLALASSPQSGAEGSQTSEELEEFVPTERVAADRAVSFPVDI